MGKRFFVLILSLIVFLLFFTGTFLFKENFISFFQSEKWFFTSLKERQGKIEEKIILLAVGDIMLDRGVEYMVLKEGGGDYFFPFSEIASYLQKGDILFGNLESVISDKGENVGGPYPFRAEPAAIRGLTSAGFDVLSVANNHLFDYGRKAMEDSLKRLKEAGIDYVGAGFSLNEARGPVIKKVGQTKIAFFAYTNLGPKSWQAEEKKSGIVWLDESFEEDIRRAKGTNDLVIVSFHFGDEYQAKPNASQELWARKAIDAGADLVVGHHPHVVQPLEKYKEGYIAYSLGNFVFDQSFSEETMKGRLLEVVIENVEIKEVIPREIMINKFFQPQKPIL